MGSKKTLEQRMALAQDRLSKLKKRSVREGKESKGAYKI